MQRDRLQAIAEEKVHDAQLLLAHGRFSNAYYLAGYAVEIGLKASIARKFLADVIPDKRFVQSIYDHNLTNLVRVAGHEGELRSRQTADEVFAALWSIVLDWTPDSRYRNVEEENAVLLIRAVADPDHGVLRWIRTIW